MRVLNSNEYKLFEQIVAMSQYGLLRTMATYLKRHYKNCVVTKEYIYAKGSIPVALVAHLDTVFEPAKEVYYDTRKNVMWSPTGLGADDRAGIFAIIKIIEAGYRPYVIFTTDEEKGGFGADSFANDYLDPPVDLKYIIELDRRGEKDCVFYECDNEKFTKYVEQFGFEKAWGSFSDISFICPSWRVAGVNLSIGYKDEHTYGETFHIDHFFNTVNKVMKMLDVANEAPFFAFVPSRRYWPLSQSKKYNCHKCKNSFAEYELIPVKTKTGSTVFYCPDCVVANVDWCKRCGEPFESEPNNGMLCVNCRSENV